MIGLYHYIAAGLFAGFALLELLLVGRKFPAITHWRLQGTAFTLLYFALATYAPLFWDGWLGEHRLFAADTLPLWVQIVGGFLVLELGIYAWHRTMHNVTFLWRWFHQMHHSPERVDIWGALYFHPFDSIGWTFLGSLALVLLFGVSAEAAIVDQRDRDLLRHVPASERPHAALAGLHHPASGEPFRSPRTRSPCAKLFRPAAVGHRLRDVPQPEGIHWRVRLLRRQLEARR